MASRANIQEQSCGFSFFFQAEDGIRDWSVTGVQTCALPIYAVGATGIERWHRENSPGRFNGGVQILRDRRTVSTSELMLYTHPREGSAQDKRDRKSVV